MPKGLLYILLFAYSASLLRPVLPYVNDLVAHVFWYSKHMATVHYENGKFHIHKDLDAASENGSKEKGLPAAKKTDTAPEHIVFSAMALVFVGASPVPNFDNSTPGIIFLSQKIELPPPRA